jgi:hypothetical protein
MRLGYIVMFVELKGIICSGARRGNQHTYALLNDRAPNAKRLLRDEALAELTRRFFTSHGPATIKDYCWWSGLTVSDAKAGLAMLNDQVSEAEIDGQQYWFASDLPPIEEPVGSYLLPVYDEYTVVYKKASSILDPAYAAQMDGFFTSVFALNGEIIGAWRRTFDKQSVVIECKPFRPFSKSEREAFSDAAHRFGDFLSMSVQLV